MTTLSLKTASRAEHFSAAPAAPAAPGRGGRLVAAMVCGLMLVQGCGSKEPAGESAAAPDDPWALVAKPRADEAQPSGENAGPSLSAVREEAKVGVGAKGRGYDEFDGVQKIVAQPAQTYFQAKEKIAFEIQIPHALQLYQALHSKGPESHQEFMEKIVEFNKIKLPQLPPGRKYVFDPELQKLMVE